LHRVKPELAPQLHARAYEWHRAAGISDTYTGSAGSRV
jgi:hypothetical protein